MLSNLSVRTPCHARLGKRGVIHGASLGLDVGCRNHLCVYSSTSVTSAFIALVLLREPWAFAFAVTLCSMTDTMTITGLVATTPRHIITAEGLAVTSFRLASNLRRFDRKRNEWVDAGTNWYTVSTYRQLAINVVGSVNKGDRVLVTGRLRIREWGDGDKKGLNIDLDADALGHDLSWGKATFTRNIHSSDVDSFSRPSEAQEEADDKVGCEPFAHGTEAADSVVEESEMEPVTPF